MSDQHRTDRVRDTLTALRSDLDTAPLSDVGSVRRRGQQRTRHQAVAVAAGAFAVVAVVVGGALGLTGSDQATSQLPASPAPSTSAPAPVPLAVDPFLQAGDVTDVGPYGRFQRSPDPFPDQPKLACLPGPQAWGAAESRSQLFFSDLDATFSEHALRYPDAAAARAGLRTITEQFTTCSKGDGSETVVDTVLPPAVPGAFAASRLTTPKTDGEVSYYELSARQTNNVVVVLEWSSQGRPTPTGVVWTPQRVALATRHATTT